MSRTIFNIRAEMADGSSFEVVADQRDIAAFECQPFGLPYFQFPARPFTAMRWMGWHAGKRQGLHKIDTWDDFDAQCEYATEITSEDEEPDSPGNPAASAGS